MKAPHADKGHLWPYHCDKHNAGHSGVCASCYVEKQKEQDEEYRQYMRDEVSRLTKENERLRDDLKRIEAAHRRDLSEYNRVSIELTRLKSALTEIAFDEWVSDEAVTIAKDALDQP